MSNTAPESLQSSRYAAPEIEAWLRAKVAGLLGVAKDDIDPREPLASLGLDSVMAICIVGELEVFLNRALPEHLVSPQASILELSQQLAP